MNENIKSAIRIVKNRYSPVFTG